MPLPSELQAIFDRIRVRTNQAVPWPSTKKVDTAFLENLKDVELIAVAVEKLLTVPPPPPPPPVPVDAVYAWPETWEQPTDWGPCVVEGLQTTGIQTGKERQTQVVVSAAQHGGSDAGPQTRTRDVTRPCEIAPPVDPVPPVGARGVTVTTAEGVWTLNPTGAVLLDGVAVGGIGREFWWLDDKLYLRSGDGTEWYLWNGSSFNPISGTPDGGPVGPVDPGTDPVPDPIEPDPSLPSAPKPAVGHPRLLATADGLVALRQRLATDSALRARWQAAVTQFEDPTGWWKRDDKKGDTYNRAFAAFLTMVRRPDDDLGLTWANPWQYYRDRIVRDAQTYTEIVDNVPVVGWNPKNPVHCPGMCLAFDCLYNDLTADERTWFQERIDQMPLGTSLGHGSEVWDNGNTIGHARSVLARLTRTDWLTHLPLAYHENAVVMETINWMPFGFGLGREWHDGYPSRNGHLFLAHCLKNAGGYSDAETFDTMATAVRDTWLLTALATSPGLANETHADPYWTSEKFHTQDTLKAFHRGLNVGSSMLWAAAILPGAFQRGATTLDITGESNQPRLANSEQDYFAYLWWKLREPSAPGATDALLNVVNCRGIGIGSPNGTTDGRQTTFYAFVPWLLYNVQEVPGKTADQAGIPLVKRWWPGTTDWTSIQSSHHRARRTAVWYVHRRYAASNYEEGTRFNGSWSLERNGPLLNRRSCTGHSYAAQSATWAMNGGMTFFDFTAHPLFHLDADWANEDMGGQRDFGGAGDTKASILREPTTDYGHVTAFHASPRVVCLTSDLTRSYNSTVIQFGALPANAPKIAQFIREFVRVLDDGTGRGKLFTYDRIILVDAKYTPMYSLCPATKPDIDGVETALVPWAPVDGVWDAKGPTRWDYAGATRLICDHADEPMTPVRYDGKVCVTWLRPSGGDVLIRRHGGFNAFKKTLPTGGHAGDPHIGPQGAWFGDADYRGFADPAFRAYVGESTVFVMPAVPQLDTRFMIACEDMAVGETPSPATELPCDSSSVAARCGASVVVFGKDGTRPSGWVDVPAGVSLVTVVNLPGGVEDIVVAQAGRVTFGRAS